MTDRTEQKIEALKTKDESTKKKENTYELTKQSL